MSDDTDGPPDRDMKDFQFRQMKQVEAFESSGTYPKERSNLLAISNKYGLTFAGMNTTMKVYFTKDILAADKIEDKATKIVKGVPVIAEATVDMTLQHLALSYDELTLSVCGITKDAGLLITFYDVRGFLNQDRKQKLPFAFYRPPVPLNTSVLDLKWNPGVASMLAVCLSDGRMTILQVTSDVQLLAELPASNSITCICWSPKGKQIAAGTMKGTVIQYTPSLEAKKVIPCPHFYNEEQPAKALDVLWLKTFVFAVVYAAGDGSLETQPELVLIFLPKKDEKVDTKYLSFGDIVYGSCTERQHHFFLSHIDEWDLVLAASAAAIEVGIIAREDEKSWAVWFLEDAARAELPVTETNEDTLPLGLAIDHTSQQEIQISDEKTLPPAPVMIILSTEGLLIPFSLLNQNPGVKNFVKPCTALALEDERMPKPESLPIQKPTTATVNSSCPGTPVIVVSSSAVTAQPFSSLPAAISSSSSAFGFSVPSTVAGAPASPSFSQGATAAFALPGLTFTSKPPLETPGTPIIPTSSRPGLLPIPNASSVKINLSERFAATNSFNPLNTGTAVASSSTLPGPSISAAKPAAVLAPVHPVQTSTPAVVVQKPAAQLHGQPSQPPPPKSSEKQSLQKKEAEVIRNGILEEISHFQKELDKFKARSSKANFKVGNRDEMRELRIETANLHMFLLEIKETTESMDGDIVALQTNLIESLARTEEATTHQEWSKHRNYHHLLNKRPLDPRSEDLLKDIRKWYQYITFALEDINDVLDLEWERHLENKRNRRHMNVPGREGLFTTLSNNRFIIKQQENRLDQLVHKLTALKLYKKAPVFIPNRNVASSADFEKQIECLKDDFRKTQLEPKPQERRPLGPIPTQKHNQLRNFLFKRQTPLVRSTAPANLCRSAFLSPKYYEDLDDGSSSSSLSQLAESQQSLEAEDEELAPLQPSHVIPVTPPQAIPRHPMVVRTPSIQPGFGSVQSAALSKLTAAPVTVLGVNPVPGPMPTNKINLSGAESTALATKTVKHGAPPTEKLPPVTIAPQQAAGSAALRRQIANQKLIGVVTLTESTLKTAPQVINVQELKDKAAAAGQIISTASSSVLDSTAPGFTSVSLTQAKRNTALGTQKPAVETTANQQPPALFGTTPSGDQSSKAFPIPIGNSGFNFSMYNQTVGALQANDRRFSFGNGKPMFGQAGDCTSGIPPRPNSSGLAAQSANTTPEVPTSTAAGALPTEPQPPKAVGGETLGSFSGLRVGQGEEPEDSSGKTSSAFMYGDSGAVPAKETAPSVSAKPAEDLAAENLSKPELSGSLFKAPENNTKPAASPPPPNPIMTASFSSLLATPVEPQDEPKLPSPPVLAPPAENEPPPAAPAVPNGGPAPASAPPAADEPPTIVTVQAESTPAATPAAPPAAPAAPAFPPAFPPAALPVPPPAVQTLTPALSATAPPAAAFQPPALENPTSVFAPPATTDSSTIRATPVIKTAVPSPPASISITTTVPTTLFRQPALPPTPGFNAPGLSQASGDGFPKTAFGQATGFAQPTTGAPAPFPFSSPAFGANSNDTASGGPGGLFGSSAPSGGTSFSFGASNASTSSSTSAGMFGQSSAFGQSVAFGQTSSMFGSNTTTSSATGFGFGQQGGFGSSSATAVFGQQPTQGNLFGQPPSTAGSLFGSSTGTPAGSASVGGFFSGLGGKPSEEAANKNPFAPTVSTGGFGQPVQTGPTGLFGNSGAKNFNYGQSAFGDEKPGGTFSNTGGSVASQGFGSFSTPVKSGGAFSSPITNPVFGSSPSFGGSPAFGAGASFGTSPSFSNPMTSSPSKVFGEGTSASNMGGFGFATTPSSPTFGNLANQAAPSFGGLAQQGSSFGTPTPTCTYPGFGQQAQTGGFSGNAFGSPNQSSSQSFGGWRS